MSINQNKTKKRLRIAIEGKLADVLDRITLKKALSVFLVNPVQGYPMNATTLRSAFDRAREKAINNNPDLAEAIKAFQFRDLSVQRFTRQGWHG